MSYYLRRPIGLQSDDSQGLWYVVLFDIWTQLPKTPQADLFQPKVEF